MMIAALLNEAGEGKGEAAGAGEALHANEAVGTHHGVDRAAGQTLHGDRAHGRAPPGFDQPDKQ